jgi:hypothetical protein
MSNTCSTARDMIDTMIDQYVYLIGSTEARPVKIGRSADPAERLVELQCGSPVLLQVFWEHLDNDEELEGLLHREFRSLRVRGEWFDFGEDDPVTVVSAVVPRLLEESLERSLGQPLMPAVRRDPWNQERPVRLPRGASKTMAGRLPTN